MIGSFQCVSPNLSRPYHAHGKRQARGRLFGSLQLWLARQVAIDRNVQLGGVRRDSYSLIFNDDPSTSIESDFTNSPDEFVDHSLAI